MKKMLIKVLTVVNAVEGVVHIVGAVISFYGMYDTGIWDWRIATSPTFDFFLGFASIITAIVLGKLHVD